MPEHGDRVLALYRQAVEHPDMLYAEQDRLFIELDNLLQRDDVLSAWFLENPLQIGLRSALLPIRDDYEFKREHLVAEAVIDADSDAPFHKFRSRESYEQGQAFEHGALAPYRPKRVLFAGSGPCPITAMSYMRAHPEASVACIERREESCRMAAEVARIFGCEALKIIQADALDVSDFSDYDCVHVSNSIGVLPEEKRRVVEHFKSAAPDSTLLVFRSSVAAGLPFFPTVELDMLGDIDYRVLPDPPNKIYTLIIVDRSSSVP